MIVDQDHSMVAGETKVFTVTARDASDDSLVDFTAATITWVVRRGATALITRTVGTGIAVVSTGVFTITLTSALTVGFEGDYAHECRATLADGTVSTLFNGVLHVAKDLTA